MLQHLDGDARMYRVYARWWKGFYAGAYREREPLFIFLLRLWCQSVGWSNQAVRGFSMLLFCLLGPATGVFIAGVSGHPLLGVAGACLMLLNPAWQHESQRGLRTELITLLLLACVSTWLWTTHALLLGLGLGLLALTQSRAATHMLLPFFWVMPSPWSVRDLLTVSAVMLLLYMPHKRAVARRNGSLYWVQDRYARYFANVEQNKQMSDSYAGPPITWRQYYLKHSLEELVTGTLLGWIELTVYMIMSPLPGMQKAVRAYYKEGRLYIGWYLFLQLPLLYFTFAGAMRGPAWVPLLALWSTLPFAFLYHKRLIEPFRNTARIYPLWLFCLLTGLGGLL